MADLWLNWEVEGSGWAVCAVGDQHAQATIDCSHIIDAPKDLLAAVARLVLYETETRAVFEAEPTGYRWIFSRRGEQVEIRLLELRDVSQPDGSGAEIWSSQQPIDTVARVVLRCFDDVARKHSESDYQAKWHRPFPRAELEALRTACRSRKR